MREIIEGIIFAVAVSALVYWLLITLGPPKHLYCSNGQPHKWGNWKFNHGMNVRTCENCGYTATDG